MKEIQLMGWRVHPRSRLEIQAAANKALEYYGDPSTNLSHVIGMLEYDGNLIVCEDNSPDWPLFTEGMFSPAKNAILYRDKDYRDLLRFQLPRSIFTLAHEMGHLCLNHERTLNREMRTEHQIFEDSEWQANTFAAEYLMPESIIRAEHLDTPLNIQLRFLVSQKAAEIRFKKMQRIWNGR